MCKRGQIPWNKGIKTGLIPKTAFKLGHTPWNKGKSYTCSHHRKHNSNETNLAISLAKIGRFKKEENPNWKGGKPCCITCGRQLSTYGAKRCPTCSSKFRMSNPEYIKKVLRRRKMSRLEEKINSYIEKNNLPYKFVGDGSFFLEGKNPDFVNTNGEKIAIEVYWQKHKDYFRGGAENWKKEREEIFFKYGWNIVFIEGTKINEKIFLNKLKGGT